MKNKTSLRFQNKTAANKFKAAYNKQFKGVDSIKSKVKMKSEEKREDLELLDTARKLGWSTIIDAPGKYKSFAKGVTYTWKYSKGWKVADMDSAFNYTNHRCYKTLKEVFEKES